MLPRIAVRLLICGAPGHEVQDPLPFSKTLARAFGGPVTYLTAVEDEADAEPSLALARAELAPQTLDQIDPLRIIAAADHVTGRGAALRAPVAAGSGNGHAQRSNGGGVATATPAGELVERDVTFKARVGGVVDEVMEELKELEYDVLIIGGPTEHSPHHARNTVERVAYWSKVPVLVVKGATKDLRRVLLCTRGSETDKLAVMIGGRLARRASAEVTLLYVNSPGARSDATGAANPPWIDRHLERSADTLLSQGVRAGIRVRTGPSSTPSWPKRLTATTTSSSWAATKPSHPPCRSSSRNATSSPTSSSALTDTCWSCGPRASTRAVGQAVGARPDRGAPGRTRARLMRGSRPLPWNDGLAIRARRRAWPIHQPAGWWERDVSAAHPARVITSSGAGRPVHSVNASAPWATSMPSPLMNHSERSRAARSKGVSGGL